MSALVVDVETTSLEGNPSAFNPNNKLLFTGCFDGVSQQIETIEYSDEPYSDSLGRLQVCCNNVDLLVGFSFKFDLHWLERYGIRLENKKILCLQVAEYILSGQTVRMPSLDDCLARRGLPPKLPFDFTVGHSEQEWRDYLAQDLKTEWLLYQEVIADLDKQPLLKRLVFDSSQDILVTKTMERNGIKYDLQKSKQIATRLTEEIREIDLRLSAILPFSWLNWASGDHLSAVLYGGIAKYSERESYERTLKDGTVRHKEHWVRKEHVFPRLVEPLEKVKKLGYFKTDEGTLKSLQKPSKEAKEIVRLVLERSKLEKKVGTYYEGIPNLYLTNNWEKGIIMVS